jgi:hypothetical protein
MLKPVNPNKCLVIKPFLPKRRITERVSIKGGEIKGSIDSILKKGLKGISVRFMAKAKINPIKVPMQATIVPKSKLLKKVLLSHR